MPDDERSKLTLGPRQRVAVAAAATIVAVAVILAAIGATGWLVAAFVGRFSSVFLPLAVAAVAALVVQPYFRLFHVRLKLPKPLAVAAVIASAVLPIAGLLWFFGAILVEQISELVSKFPDWSERLVAAVRERWPEVQQFFEQNPWGQRIRAAVEGQQQALLDSLDTVTNRALRAGRGVVGGFTTLASWAVAPVYFVFFLMADSVKPRELGRYLPFFRESTRNDIVYLVDQFIDIVVAFFRDQLVIAFLQGILLAIGFAIVGLKYGLILGVLLGLLNIVPYLGSIIGLAVCLPLAYFQPEGGWPVLIGVLVVFVIVQNIEGYVLTPRIMGDRTGLHPVTIIVAVFFWGSALGGILGMLLAIPLTAFLVVFWRLAREKYIAEIV